MCPTFGGHFTEGVAEALGCSEGEAYPLQTVRLYFTLKTVTSPHSRQHDSLLRVAYGSQQTPIIYLDEPTAFLDYPSKVETMQLLRRLAIQQQKTIFLSTHDVELSLQVADCIWLMEPDMLSVGTPRELAAQGALSRFIERADITFDKETLQIRVLC